MPHKNRPRPLAGGPPPAGVMVVIGDPPSGRGQPATSRQTEETHQDKIQLRNRPLKRVNPNARALRRWRDLYFRCAQCTSAASTARSALASAERVNRP